MKSEHLNWIISAKEGDLERYQKDGRDLSPYIDQGQRISDLRNLADISVADLASGCGLKVNELLAMEAGLQQPNQSEAKRMAECMGIKFSDLWVDNTQ